MRLNNYIAFFTILFVLVTSAYGQAACGQKSNIAEQCSSDEDCVDKGTVCKLINLNTGEKLCKCHDYYMELTDNKAKYCALCPKYVNDTCSTKCRPPLQCYLGTCRCIRGEVKNRLCFPRSEYLAYCNDDSDCRKPFMTCQTHRTTGGNSKACKCIGGSFYDKAKKQCIANLHCPDGSNPIWLSTAGKYKSCALSVVGASDQLENQANTGSTLDNCGRQEYCVTTGYSPVGHCCQQRCPLGNELTRYSCDPASDNNNKCPQDTHYCHRMVGPGFSTTSCCQRPCRQPTPVYYDGKCYESSAYNGKCTADIQCDGGVTMSCTSNKCRCKRGYVRSSDPSAGGMTCAIRCPERNQKGIESNCYAPARLNTQCTVDWQCSGNSSCHMGMCKCSCGFEEKLGQCIDPRIRGDSGNGSSISGSNNGLFGGGNPLGPLLELFGGATGTSTGTGTNNAFAKLLGNFGTLFPTGGATGGTTGGLGAGGLGGITDIFTNLGKATMRLIRR